MILTDELCDVLCAAALEKAKRSVLISALPSVMNMVCPKFTGAMVKRWY